MLYGWSEPGTSETEERMVFIMNLKVEGIYTEKVLSDTGFHQKVEVFQVKIFFIRNGVDFAIDFYKNVYFYENVLFFQYFYISLYLDILHKCTVKWKIWSETALDPFYFW